MASPSGVGAPAPDIVITSATSISIVDRPASTSVPPFTTSSASSGVSAAAPSTSLRPLNVMSMLNA